MPPVRSDLDDLYSEAVKEAITLADPDDVILETLEFRHPTIVDALGNPTGLRFVNDYGALASDADPEQRMTMLTLEADAPIDAGRSVPFVACAFKVTPAAQEQGGKPVLQIDIDGIAAAIQDDLDAMVDEGSALELTYRIYLASRPEAPESISPHATVNSVSSTLTRVTAEAGYPDTINRTFPSKIYRPNEFPSLAE